MFNLWKVVGVALVVWVAWDLYMGYTVAWDWIYRDESPTAYWSVLSLWAVLAVSCFFSWDESD